MNTAGLIPDAIDRHGPALGFSAQEPHPHADLMRQYAEDAAQTSAPWERWELLDSRTEQWYALTQHPRWDTCSEYRRSPQC